MDSSRVLMLALLFASIFLQAAAAYMALKLIGITGRLRAWVCISLAITLMAVRRIISLSWIFSGQPGPPLELGFEVVGLATSALMLAGIALIRPLFLAQRESEAAVRRLNEQSRLLLENSSDIVYRHDTRGVFTYVSPACEKITGLTPEQWRVHYETLHTDNPLNDRAVAATEEALRTGKEQPPYEIEIFHRNGSRVWLEISERPYLEHGRVSGIIGVAREITGRKAAEAEREKLIGELQAALASIKTLRGFLPICASCKKIRDDKGYWNQLEIYLREHADVEFSHGICPDCARKLYPRYSQGLPETPPPEPRRG
jgi:PAS domain S-box-containing protein